jgi:hypothetical protein
MPDHVDRIVSGVARVRDMDFNEDQSQVRTISDPLSAGWQKSALSKVVRDLDVILDVLPRHAGEH